MSRLLVRNGVFNRGPFRGGLGEDAAPASIPASIVDELKQHFSVGKQIDARTTLILAKIEEQDRARKWALVIGGVSALFAAVKLGLVTFGHIKSRAGG